MLLCFYRSIVVLITILISATMTFAEKKDFSICWSHYTGWEPWAYADQSGIMKKWADKYGIKVKIDLINDYVESINLYTAGKYDGCTMTNVDALTIPAVGGVDSTALIVGDYSNGNDGIVLRDATSVKDLRGKSVMLVELSVSHYLLARALSTAGIQERELKLMNTSDADIASAFMANPSAAVVTWNPILMQVRNAPKANLLYDSSKIPGEILDLLVMRTDAPDSVKKAMVGAWFEVMAKMSGGGKDAEEALAAMAKSAGGTIAEFKTQLKSTRMYYDSKEATDFVKTATPRATMDYVRTFSFDHGLYGNGATSKDLVGIEFADGTVLGDKSNVKLRFSPKYMQMAAERSL